MRGSCSIEIDRIQPRLGRRHDERTLGGVTLHLPPAVAADEPRIRREDAGAQQRTHARRWLDDTAGLEDLTGGIIAGA